MAAYANVTFWREFIAMYKNAPETWKIKSELYKNKYFKNQAYTQLLEKLKTIEPNATMDTLKKRLNSLRGCYRRELNKVKKSKKSAYSAFDVYTPSLWYFDDMSFLQDQETPDDTGQLIDTELHDSVADAGEEGTIDWSKKATLALIDQWQQYPFLYDDTHVKHSNKFARRDAFRKIAKQLKCFYANIGPEDIRKRTKDFTRQYASELAKQRKSDESGVDGEDLFEPPYWFHKLSFLQNNFKEKEEGTKLDAMSSGSSCNDLDSCDLRDLELSDSTEIEQIFLPISAESSYDNPPASKRRKISKSQKDVLVKHATDVLKKISSAPPETSSQFIYPPDVEAFGNLVKSEFYKLTDEELKDEVQHKILNIFYDIKKKQRSLKQLY